MQKANKLLLLTFSMIKLALLFILLLLIGCSQCNEPLFKPKKSDMQGVWVLSQPSKQFVLSKGYSSSGATINLLQDNTFKIEMMPSMWRSRLGKADGKFESITGKWTVWKPGALGTLLDISVRTVNSEPVRFMYAGCQICKRDGELTLNIYVGDPDNNNLLIFKKSKI